MSSDVDPRDDRLFTRGFIAFPAGSTPSTSALWRAVDEVWAVTDFAGLRIRHHPRTPVTLASHTMDTVAVIGDIFDPRSQVLTTADELAGLTETQLHARLEHLSGRFVIIVDRGGEIAVYHDAIGSRSVYYVDDDSHAFASHIELLAAAFPQRKDERVSMLSATSEHKSRKVRYAPGDATAYELLYALPPNHRLLVSQRRPQRYWPTLPPRATTFDQFIQVSDDYHAGLATFLRSREAVLGVTGGVDARVLVAGLSSLGVPMSGCTWMGGWIAQRELPIIRDVIRIAQMTNVPIHMDEKEDDQALSRLAGFNAGRGTSKITAAMSEVYGSNPRVVFVRGYGGEVMRGFYNVSRNPLRDVSPAELMRMFGSGIKVRPPSAEYESLCRPFFERWAEITNIDEVVRLGYDGNDIFYWEHRMGMWGASMLNELDPAMNNIVGLNSRSLFAASYGLPQAERLTKDFMLRITQHYSPSLAALPYC